MTVIAVPKQDKSCKITYEGVLKIEYNPMSQSYKLIFRESEIGAFYVEDWDLYKPSMQKVYGGRYTVK